VIDQKGDVDQHDDAVGHAISTCIAPRMEAMAASLSLHDANACEAVNGCEKPPYPAA